MNITDFFDLTIPNEQLYKVGEVEDGYTHGVEERNGEYYATLYHLQRHIAKGELKTFLQHFDGSEALATLGATLRREYEVPDIQVRYKGQSFAINKYPFSIVLDYFKRSINQSVLTDNPLPHTVENAINAIGFKNFRRFEQLDPLELKGVTFFVGQNNSGKSTVIKALTLLSNYLNQQDLSVLHLTDPARPESANIFTFDRALNRKAKINGPEVIEFELFLKDFKIKLIATANDKDRVLNIKYLIVNLGEFETRFSFEGNIVRIEIKPKQIQEEDLVETAFNDIYDRMLVFMERLNEQLEDSTLSMTERLKLADDKNRLEFEINKRKASKKVEKHDRQLIINQTIDPSFVPNANYLSLMEEAINLYIENTNTLKGKGKIPLQDQLNSIKISNKYIFDRSKEFYELIQSLRSHHIGTNNGSQQALLLMRDQYNPLARVAHSYYSIQTTGESIPELFVKKWLGKEGFGVADDLEVVSVEDEGYSIKLKDVTGDIPLSDMGMGTQQIVLLVLTMAVLIDKYPSKSFTPMIMVEEPEVNLHPRLESKLTEFFLEVHEKFNFKFIIETHSEYMIRNSQLIGLKEGFFQPDGTKPNPFKVYYFDQENGPYEMKYQNDGKFDKRFGTGFFDESDNTALEIYQISKNLNK